MLTRLVSGGALGRKTGRGFYSYDDFGEKSDTASADGATPGGRPVRSVGVVGSGTMARGIAEVAAKAGHPTVVVARDRAKEERVLEEIEASLTRSVRRGRVSPQAKASALALLRAGAGPGELLDCDRVIEAVVENLDVKRSVFATLGAVCRPGTVLATTTSSLPVQACAEASGRPSDVVGMHFFNPAPVMKLVELARASGSSDDAAATARAFCRALGKTTVDCTDRTGFIANYCSAPEIR